MRASEVRSAALGELLTRALALFRSRWPALCAIFALAAIPSVLLQAAAEPSFARLIDAANAVFRAGDAGAAVRARLIADLGAALASAGGPVLVCLVAQLAVVLLAQPAALRDLSRALDDAPQTVAASYAQAARRWFPQLLVGLAFVVISWAVLLAVFPLAAVAVDVIVLSPLRTSAPALTLAVTAAGTGVVACAYALGYLAWLTATASVADGAPVLAAVRAALKRTLEPAARRRTFVLAALLVAANWSASLALAAIAGGAVAATQAGALAFAIPALGGVGLDALRSAVIAVYARDVRLRREGADLLLAAAAPSTGPAGDDGLDPDDRALIVAFLERRATFDAAAATEIAARIAARVRPKLRASFHYLDDVALLEHLDRSRG